MNKITLLTVLGVLVLSMGVYRMGKKDSLKTYREKRDFKKTPEPSKSTKRGKKNEPIFVIQYHEARATHYDFRLQVGDVLISWAVPKGPSLNPEEKRLAIMTEDHPLDYADFEGVIPEGEYGAGPVMVWDTGTYTNIKEDKEGNIVPMEKCIEDGTVEVFLHGKKLEGGFVLFRFKGKEDNQWLLKKIDDEYASKKRKPVSTETKSVLSGRSMTQIEKEGKKEG